MSKYRKTTFGKHKTVGYGWVGKWSNPRSTFGWAMPSHLGWPPNRPPLDRAWIRKGDMFFLCRITVQAVKDSQGRLIRRSAGQLRKDEGG